MRDIGTVMTGEAPIAQRHARHHRAVHYSAQEQMILYTERVPKPYDPRASTSRWCPLPDSNRNSFRNRILSAARLPIPPKGHTTANSPILSKEAPVKLIDWIACNPAGFGQIPASLKNYPQW